jgi:hypothetical protein
MHGFHGTEAEYVTEILTKGFTASIRKDHWLGQGFYFYTDLDLAKWWAVTKFKNPSQRAAVIQAEIAVPDTQLLDLDTRLGMNTFFYTIKEIYAKDLKLSFNFKDEHRIQNLCLALDLVKYKLGIKVIRRSFLKDKPSYGAQNIEWFERDFFPLPNDFAYLETQICVSDNSCVLKKECVFLAPPNPPPPRRRTWS